MVGGAMGLFTPRCCSFSFSLSRSFSFSFPLSCSFSAWVMLTAKLNRLNSPKRRSYSACEGLRKATTKRGASSERRAVAAADSTSVFGHVAQKQRFLFVERFPVAAQLLACDSRRRCMTNSDKCVDGLRLTGPLGMDA